MGGSIKRYEYPRYFFSNASVDIRGLCCWALGRVSVGDGEQSSTCRSAPSPDPQGDEARTLSSAPAPASSASSVR